MYVQLLIKYHVIGMAFKKIENSIRNYMGTWDLPRQRWSSLNINEDDYIKSDLNFFYVRYIIREFLSCTMLWKMYLTVALL